MLDFYVRFQLFGDMFHFQLLYHSFFGSFMLYVDILNEYFTLAAKHGVEDVYSFEAHGHASGFLWYPKLTNIQVTRACYDIQLNDS